ncbi:MAG: hypothetical protein KGJ23_13990 [Euryarchaeota archaeon]|nr:hypothetical protein [Euryarchaeota archaeon]MDE1837709.1 hypothetical protein [Euryarchaeota archaeon]MDE1881732.1 hypothetical protein [Euryarchaeota archaeon]MDE2045961.1 hypothetical protein [Thermoplasmata archaeon]
MPRGRPPALTPRQVARVRRLARGGARRDELAMAFRVGRSTIVHAIYGQRAYAALRRPPPLPRGGAVVHPGLSPAKVREARKLVRGGEPRGRLARRLGVSPALLRRALYGRPPYEGIARPPPLTNAERGDASLPEREWARRRALALTCTTWDEYARKLGTSGVNLAMARRHGVRLLCAICRRQPATTMARGERTYRSSPRGETRTRAAFVGACEGCARAERGAGRVRTRPTSAP